MRRILALMLALMLITGVAAADLRRGSRGDDVRQMQERLIEMGFLEDKADGVFGKKTEAAVKRFQKYAGLRVTGVVDDETDFTLMDVYFTATGEMADDGADPEELREMYPESCSWEGRDEWGAQFCWRHQEIAQLEKILNLGVPPAPLAMMLESRLAACCEEAIGFLYDEWSEEDDAAYDQQEIFENALEEQRPEWAKQNTTDMPYLGIAAEAMWLESQMIDLCHDLHGAEANE